MPQLIISLTDEEHALLLTKAGKFDLQQITRIALDNYFARHRHTEKNTFPLDLSGRAKTISAIEANRIDPRKPIMPSRNEVMLDGRNRFQTDEAYEKVMDAYRWQLARYENEKNEFEEKKRKGTINEWGGISFVN